ncbi:hypothetical protein TWF696_003442 [Orbilia brochopaga]|uniref:Uncharacterized protein n=1 Tax=Orbilia brochopaga TaxID=3140254 RepID=A0AAV9TXE5_9PEZI
MIILRLVILLLEIYFAHASAIVNGAADDGFPNTDFTENEVIRDSGDTLEKRLPRPPRVPFKRVPNVDYSRPINQDLERAVERALEIYDVGTKATELVSCGITLFVSVLDNGNPDWCKESSGNDFILGSQATQTKHSLALGSLVDSGRLPNVVRNITDVDPAPIVAAARSKPAVRKMIVRYIVALQMQEDQKRSSRGFCRLYSALSLTGECVEFPTPSTSARFSIAGPRATSARSVISKWYSRRRGQISPLTRRTPLPQQAYPTQQASPTSTYIPTPVATVAPPGDFVGIDDASLDDGVYEIVGRYFSAEWSALDDSLDEPTKAISNAAWTTAIRTTTIPPIFEEDAPFTVSYIVRQEVQSALRNDASVKAIISNWLLYTVVASVAFIITLL